MADAKTARKTVAKTPGKAAADGADVVSLAKAGAGLDAVKDAAGVSGETAAPAPAPAPSPATAKVTAKAPGTGRADGPIAPPETGLALAVKAPAKPVAPTAVEPVSPEHVAAAPSALPVPSIAKETPMTTDIPTKPFETIAPAMEKVTADMTAKVKDMMEKNMKSMTEMTEFAKGNVEAMVESAKAAAAGAETLTAHMVETSKKSMEEAQAAFKAMTSAKSPNEMMAAQNEFAKAQFDKAVANMSHFSEAWMKLAGDVVQPISSRMAVAAETMKKSIAV